VPKAIIGAASLVLAAVLVAPACGGDERSIILATTTSVQDSGLLDVLVPAFEERSGYEVKVIAVGSGAALAMAERGDADAVFVHSPAAEQRLVDAGHLVEGALVMANDFVIVGPAADPAGVGEATSLADALRRIASTGPFVSRGDESGTHAKELELWRTAGIDPGEVRLREETGQGMGATLNVANEKRAYTLTDRATFLVLRDELDLEVLFAGDPALANPYHAYVVNPDRHPKVRAEGAREFVRFLTSAEAQRLIGEFGKERFGSPLFRPAGLATGR